MEFKFRAWVKPENKYLPIASIDFFNEEVVVWGCGYDNCGMCDDDYPMNDVILELGTGLKDKSGVNIFDGDICKMHYFFENYDGFGAFEDEAEITCRITITPFGLRFEGEGMSGYLHEYVEEPGEELEVIGNIHDNPELMEVQSEKP